MTSMNVPEPVMSLAIAPASKSVGPQVWRLSAYKHSLRGGPPTFKPLIAFVGCEQFSKALNRFQKEDPTFRVTTDPNSGQVVSYLTN